MNQQFDLTRQTGTFGLYGGSFDPVHNGHLFVARLALKELGLDGVVFLPSGQPPHQSARVMASAEHRLAMLRLAIAGQEGMFWSDFELNLPPPQYTYQTLELLAQYPARWVFIMGGDSLLQLGSWRCTRRILAAAPVAAVQRPGIRLEDMEAARRALEPERITILPCLGVDASSSGARAGEWEELPAQVERYIRQEGLYGYEPQRA